MKTAMIALTLVFSAASPSAQELTKPAKEYLERLVNEKFGNAILMTDRGCSEFGKDWKRYEEMAGRFPLGVGKGVDDRGETSEFWLHDRAGEYRHLLTKPEMPSHRHKYHDRSHGALPSKVDHGDDRAQEYRDAERTTKPAGNNQPHNNMPPYLVLNFCHYKR